MANQHAAAIVRMGGDISAGNKLSEASRTEWESLSKSLEDERTKVNRTEQLEFELSMAVAEMGQGLLKVLMGLIALLAHGFMNITGAARALYSHVTGDKSYSFSQMLEESDKRWQAIVPLIGSGLEQAASGLNRGVDAIGDSGVVDIKPILNSLSGTSDPKPTPLKDLPPPEAVVVPSNPHEGRRGGGGEGGGGSI
jgi:hypothetical protein